MKIKFKNPEQKIKKALKDLVKALTEEIQLELEIEELEKQMISESDALRIFDLKPSELRLMEKNGLEFIDEGGVRFYNQIEFEGYYDQQIYGVKSQE